MCNVERVCICSRPAGAQGSSLLRRDGAASFRGYILTPCCNSIRSAPYHACIYKKPPWQPSDAASELLFPAFVPNTLHFVVLTFFFGLSTTFSLPALAFPPTSPSASASAISSSLEPSAWLSYSSAGSLLLPASKSSSTLSSSSSALPRAAAPTTSSSLEERPASSLSAAASSCPP